MHLTGVPEVDFQIILSLDSNSLFSACSVNHYIGQLCNTDYFWKNKIRYDFGDSPLQYLPNDESYREQYSNIIQIDTPRQAIVSKRPDALCVFLEKGHVFSINDINLAADIGDLEILNLLEYYRLIPNHEGAGAAAENGDIETLLWLAARGIFPNSAGANMCARQGHLHILKWMASHNIYPTVWGANFAHSKGHRHVSEWLSANGIHPSEIIE
jgi:hypothetical protein